MSIPHAHTHNIDPKSLGELKNLLKGSVSQLADAAKGGKIQHSFAPDLIKKIRSGTKIEHSVNPKSMKGALTQAERFLEKQKSGLGRKIFLGSLLAGVGATAGKKAVNSVLPEKTAFWRGFEKSARELTSKARSNLPESAFVFPEKRKYPIHDENHARNALARVAQFGSPSEQKAVRAAVHSKFPGIGD